MRHPVNNNQPKVFKRPEDRDFKIPRRYQNNEWEPKAHTKIAGLVLAGIVAGVGLKTAWDNMDVGCVISAQDNVHTVTRNDEISSESSSRMFYNEPTDTCETKTFSFKSLDNVTEKVRANPQEYKWQPAKVGL